MIQSHASCQLDDPALMAPRFCVLTQQPPTAIVVCLGARSNTNSRELSKRGKGGRAWRAGVNASGAGSPRALASEVPDARSDDDGDGKGSVRRKVDTERASQDVQEDHTDSSREGAVPNLGGNVHKDSLLDVEYIDKHHDTRTGT